MADQEGWKGEAKERGGQHEVESGMDEEAREAGEDAEEGDGTEEGDGGSGGDGGEVEEARGDRLEQLLDVRGAAGVAAGLSRASLCTWWRLGVPSLVGVAVDI